MLVFLEYTLFDYIKKIRVNLFRVKKNQEKPINALYF